LNKKRDNDIACQLTSHVQDPLRAAASESRGFNQLWLKNGRDLAIGQRIGFVIFSLAFIAFGISELSNCIEAMREDNLFAIGYGLSAGLLLLVGGFGVRNVLRFK